MKISSLLVCSIVLMFYYGRLFPESIVSGSIEDNPAEKIFTIKHPTAGTGHGEHAAGRAIGRVVDSPLRQTASINKKTNFFSKTPLSLPNRSINLSASAASSATVWEVKFPESKYSDRVYDAKTDSAGNVFILGLAWENDSSFVLIAKVNPQGELTWEIKYPFSRACTPHQLYLDSLGDVYMTIAYGYEWEKKSYWTMKISAAGSEQWRYQHAEEEIFELSL